MGHIGLVMGLISAIALCPLADATAAAPVVHRVIIGKLAFGPSPSDIHVGDTVEWVNQDIFQHSATADDKSFDVDMPPDATARVVVRMAGTIRYTCKYHPGMIGQLVVTK